MSFCDQGTLEQAIRQGRFTKNLVRGRKLRGLGYLNPECTLEQAIRQGRITNNLVRRSGLGFRVSEP